MSGYPEHLSEMAHVFLTRLHPARLEKATFAQEVHVFVAESNTYDCTYDGIDWGAERALQEVGRLFASIQLNNINIMNHSLTRSSKL